MKTIRCSSLPRIMSCTASGQEPDIRIDSDNEIARVGNAAHEAYARMVEGKDVDLSAIALNHSVDENELAMLYWQGKSYWDELKLMLSDVEAERELSFRFRDNAGADYLLTGHPDASAKLIGDADTSVIIDWKTGHKETDPRDQVLGYALLQATNAPPKKILIILVWTRLGQKDIYEYTRDEIYAFSERLGESLSDERKTYVPSEANCMYCPRQHDCPAKKKLLESSYSQMQEIMAPDSAELMTAEGMAALYPKSRMLKKALVEYEHAMNAMLESGDIVADGKRYSLEDRSRKTIQFDRKTLSDYMPSNLVDDLKITVTRTDIDTAIMSCSPKGQGAANKRDCMEALQKSGMVKENSYRQIKITTEREEVKKNVEN